MQFRRAEYIHSFSVFLQRRRKWRWSSWACWKQTINFLFKRVVYKKDIMHASDKIFFLNAKVKKFTNVIPGRPAWRGRWKDTVLWKVEGTAHCNKLVLVNSRGSNFCCIVLKRTVIAWTALSKTISCRNLPIHPSRALYFAYVSSLSHHHFTHYTCTGAHTHSTV